jgi:hypothetical protein
MSTGNSARTVANTLPRDSLTVLNGATVDRNCLNLSLHQTTATSTLLQSILEARGYERCAETSASPGAGYALHGDRCLKATLCYSPPPWPTSGCLAASILSSSSR